MAADPVCPVCGRDLEPDEEVDGVFHCPDGHVTNVGLKDALG